jgi:hypothetical protein
MVVAARAVDPKVMETQALSALGAAMEATNPNVFPADWPIGSLSGWSSSDAPGAEVKDLFDAWVFAARDAELALDAWASGTNHERATAHAVYRAALDREERAAEVLAIAASSKHGSPVADDRANGESTAAAASAVRESSPVVAGRASMRQARGPADGEHGKPRR